MKKLIFLERFILNNLQYEIGESLQFTTEFETRKKRLYLPADLIDKLVEDEVAIILDPDMYQIDHHNVLASFANFRETASENFVQGLISDAQYLIQVISGASQALLSLEHCDAKALWHMEEVNRKVEEAFKSHKE